MATKPRSWFRSVAVASSVLIGTAGTMALPGSAIGAAAGVAIGDRAPQTFLVSPGRYDWNRDPGGTTFLRYAAQYEVPDISLEQVDNTASLMP